MAAAAAISNPLTNAPLRPAPPWTPNHYYLRGEVVKNGSTHYICYTAGTSAAAIGPTGIKYVPIADGSVEWVVYGGPTVKSRDPNAPVVTSTTDTALLESWGLDRLHNPVVTPSSFSFGGGVPTPAPSMATTQVAFPAVHAYANNKGGNTGFNDGTSNLYWSATFLTDAPKVAIGVSSAVAATIIVDGRSLVPGGTRGASGGNPVWFALDFTNAGGRKKRTITIEEFGSVRFAGVRIDGTSTLAAPPAADKVRVAFLGSSIEVGGKSFPVLASFNWPIQVSKLLGWADPWNLGLGGTGYIADLAGQSFSYIEHIDDAISISPDIVVVGGPINDADRSTPAAITSAAVQLFRTLRTALPDVPVVAMGTFPGNSGPSAARTNSERAIQSAVQQLADPRLFFVPVISPPAGLVITGTGTTASPNGKGNADYYVSSDGTHPNQLGMDYEAVQYAARIKAIVVNTLP